MKTLEELFGVAEDEGLSLNERYEAINTIERKLKGDKNRTKGSVFRLVGICVGLGESTPTIQRILSLTPAGTDFQPLKKE
jgi:hypothetical protein